jgi:predicted 3-demethylubiquinone-9 3-methyltransferase (glyoxalase superfamily)
MPRIVTNLWFDKESQEAAEFYCSVFPNSKVTDVTHYPKGSDREGEVLTVDFELDGTPFTALDGGPQLTFDEAISMVIECQDQAEIDRYWDALIADGGEPSQCGWLKDRFGLSWQIVPPRLGELLGDPDPEKAARVMQAMLGMQKIVIADLEAA